MLRMTTMPKRKHIHTHEEGVEVKDTEQTEKLLTLADLPRRKPKPIQPGAAPTKILNMSDLPKRAAVGRRIVREARKQQSMFPRQSRGKDLAPKVFAEYVGNNAWKGRRCFIVGGGPSVKDMDLSLLCGEMTIGINRAYELFDPSILYGVDGQMWGWVEQGKCGEESKRKFNAYRGYKVWMALHKVFPPDFYLIDVDEYGGHRVGTTRKLAFKSNSGYGAINLAAALGANPIYLLGFDMHGDKQGKQKWWHNGYPVDYGENVYKRYIADLNDFAPVLEHAGVEVVNLNPKSALKCFTFGNYADVVARKPAIPADAIRVMAQPDMVTAITPTGDRPLAFTLCQHWMEMQTRRPDQWIVVDDGKVPLKPTPMMEYIRRAPRPDDPPHTLNLNIKTALPYIKGSKIIIIEDDEYYAPRYVETMARELDLAEVVGITLAKYYHLPTGGYAQLANTIHASLAQTGFRSTVLPLISQLVEERTGHYLDMRLWQHIMPEQRGYLFGDGEASLYAGMKGLPGRGGIGLGHDPASYGKTVDANRTTLKKWTGADHRVYVDLAEGKLTEANCHDYFNKVTGIVVCQNTLDLMKRAYESVRRCHPEMPIVVVDGSDVGDPCAEYVRGLRTRLTTVIQPGYNIGHGNGMCVGIDHAKTPYALIFDSDIEMLQSPVDAMLAQMGPDTFGIGYLEKTGLDGYEYGAKQNHLEERWMPMLHPYFHLINIANYRKFHPYVHHGAPCYLTALDIYKQGLSDTVLKEFPGLGHTSGKGWSWIGKPSPYVRHDTAGTRRDRVSKGKGEIDGNWVFNRGVV